MIFSIGSQFSKEFSFEESSITMRLGEKVNSYFENKKYGNRIEKIYISVICVSKGFEQFFKVRPMKIYRAEHSLEYELKLDFGTFKSSTEEQRTRLLVGEILRTTKKVLIEKTINGFEKEEFIRDLEAYFKQHGYLEETII